MYMFHPGNIYSLSIKVKNELTDTGFFFVIGWVGNKYFYFDLSELKIPPAKRAERSREDSD